MFYWWRLKLWSLRSYEVGNVLLFQACITKSHNQHQWADFCFMVQRLRIVTYTITVFPWSVPPTSIKNTSFFLLVLTVNKCPTLKWEDWQPPSIQMFFTCKLRVHFYCLLLEAVWEARYFFQAVSPWQQKKEVVFDRLQSICISMYRTA